MGLAAVRGLAAFFERRTNQKRGLHWLDYSPAWRVEQWGAKALGLVEYCAKCESVALWVNPEPNAQLSLIWLLDYLRSYKELASRLTLVQGDLPVTSQSAENLAKLPTLAVRLRDEHLAVASTAWRAYRAPTPQAWRNLLDQDLTVLPQLRQTVMEMLEELPSGITGSKLSLTALGEAILAGTEDFTRHNPVDRWWGGTHLATDNLWRWNAASKTLIAP